MTAADRRPRLAVGGTPTVISPPPRRRTPGHACRPRHKSMPSKQRTGHTTLTSEFARRAIEVAIHEAKRHLGFEEPQGWTRRAVERTAPTAMLLYGLVAVWFLREGHQAVSFPRRLWYRQKRDPSFADMLTTLRRQCLRATFLQTPMWDRESKKIILSLVDLCSQAA